MGNTKEENSKPQPSKRKVFETTQKYLAIAGIRPSLVHRSCPFDWLTSFGLLFLGLNIYCTSAFIMHDAETIDDYTQSIYAASFLILMTMALMVLILEVENLFEFIRNSDDLVHISELQRAIRNICLQKLKSLF